VWANSRALLVRSVPSRWAGLDLGDHYFIQCDKDRVTKRLLQRLRDLGLDVEVKNAA
jgi:hypothetical protein